MEHMYLIYQYFKLKYNNTKYEILNKILKKYHIHINLQSDLSSITNFIDNYFLLYRSTGGNYIIQDLNCLEIKSETYRALELCYCKNGGESNYLYFLEIKQGRGWGIIPKNALLDCIKLLDL